MTREENIRAILDTCFSESKYEIKEVALKSIMSLSAEAEQTIRHIENNTKESDLVYRPSVEADRPSGDLIERDEAIKTIIRICSPICDMPINVIEALHALPSAAEAKEGVIYYEGKAYKGGTE